MRHPSSPRGSLRARSVARWGAVVLFAAVPSLAAYFGTQQGPGSHQAAGPHQAAGSQLGQGTMTWALANNDNGRVLGPIAVVGDSNSVAPWFTPGWVEMAERLLGLAPGQIVNTSIPGATAGPHPELPLTKSGPTILDQALNAGQVLDGLIFALGTNDISYGHDAAQVKADLDELIAEVQAYDSEIEVFVALVPPLVDPVVNASGLQTEIDALNALIVASMPADRVIDFHALLSDGLLGTEFTYYNDGIHHNALASALKAQAVVEVLSVAYGLPVAMKLEGGK
ncbi:SGNH/GDSL hydrolase family protein [Engelhardtia mirabilis]|uniref:SGNH hydrolase-type esterase domain-containing protein n=1 Tax=Engelhardtia mirabilis TaxID=2528011 RepID=A0A518BLZ4_9BACT|nr:hypothetical protein Pla133_30850 [Planctomycetes bacterium Pla133]QDV02320.1 hypothetical protein Pla86_30840 [Planctomycetes bacterium Pla86]